MLWALRHGTEFSCVSKIADFVCTAYPFIGLLSCAVQICRTTHAYGGYNYLSGGKEGMVGGQIFPGGGQILPGSGQL